MSEQNDPVDNDPVPVEEPMLLPDEGEEPAPDPDQAPEPSKASETASEAQPSDAERIAMEDPKDEEAPRETYAGDYKSNPNVNEVLPVLEELSEEQIEKLARQGELFLSNLELDEIMRLERIIRRQIGESQAKRKASVESAQPNDLFEMTAKVNGRDARIYVNRAEAETLQLLQIYTSTVRNGGNLDLLEVGDKWTNLPSVQSTKIGIAQVDQSRSKNPISVMRAKLGLSAQHSVPVWGSGFNMVLEGPGALEQLSLDTKVLLEKIMSGAESNGYVFSASSVYLNRSVMDFILDQVKSTTLGITDPRELKKYILITDLEGIALGCASTLFPEGYLLRRPCLTNYGGCGHVVERKVNVRRMLFVAESKLSDNQLHLMTRRTSRVDPEQVLNYQRDMRPDVSRYIPLVNGISLRMKVPNLDLYERIAINWLAKIEQSAKKLNEVNATSDERKDFMNRAAAVALLMAYGHWIDAIVQFDEENPANEPTVIVERLDDSNTNAQYEADAEIERTLVDMSGDSDLAEKAVTGIEKFIGQMTIATAAVPKVICPKCNNPVTGDDTSKHPHLVTVNPIELFFTLLRRKIQIAGG